MNDQEVAAISTVTEALEPLDDESRQRVIDYIMARFAPNRLPQPGTPEEADVQPIQSAPKGPSNAEYLPDFFNKVNPSSDSEKALTIGYWFQCKQDQSDFQAEKVNDELKQLGYRLSNVTRAFNDNMNTKPAHIIQTSKQGSGKQGRKSYRLTEEGKKKIESML